MSIFNTSLPIAIGADHAGYDGKADLLKYLESKGLTYKDFGTFSADSVDYPDFAHPVALSLATGEYAFGILLCGSANGVAITANKHQHIRAAVCWEAEIAELARKHNDANIICIPSRYVSFELSEQMVQLFIDTHFEGGRHERRVEKIEC